MEERFGLLAVATGARREGRPLRSRVQIRATAHSKNRRLMRCADVPAHSEPRQASSRELLPDDLRLRDEPPRADYAIRLLDLGRHAPQKQVGVVGDGRQLQAADVVNRHHLVVLLGAAGRAWQLVAKRPRWVGNDASERLGAHRFPVWPKPRSPRAVSLSCSTRTSSTRSTGAITSWAMRSPGWTSNFSTPRFVR